MPNTKTTISKEASIKDSNNIEDFSWAKKENLQHIRLREEYHKNNTREYEEEVEEELKENNNQSDDDEWMTRSVKTERGWVRKVPIVMVIIQRDKKRRYTAGNWLLLNKRHKGRRLQWYASKNFGTEQGKPLQNVSIEEQIAPLRCANCEGQHPASYQECYNSLRWKKNQ